MEQSTKFVWNSHSPKAFNLWCFRHTIEDLQEFGNAGIPTPPWIHAESVLIPISVCDVAATHLIKAFGGEEVTQRVVGGTKWWQVRGIHGYVFGYL
jgi:hypothetical protein